MWRETPTQKDGWNVSKEIAIYKKAGSVIFETSRMFGRPMACRTASVAVTLFLRFFQQHSMTKYHSFVIAVVSLYVAGKIEDEPKALFSVINRMMRVWYNTDKSPDYSVLIDLRKKSLYGEHLMMVTIGFDFDVDVLLEVVYRLTEELPELHQLKSFKNQHACAILCNDIMKYDGTMTLQFTLRAIGLSVCHFLFQKSTYAEMPKDTPDGNVWYQAHGLPSIICTVLCERIETVYATMPSKMSLLSAEVEEGEII